MSLGIVSNATLLPRLLSFRRLRTYTCMYVYVRRCGREGRGVVTRPRDETGSGYSGRGACYPVTMVTRAPVAMGMKHDTASWIDHITTTHRAVLRGGTFPSPRLAATNSRHRLAYIALCVTRCTLILRVRNTLVGLSEVLYLCC